MQTLSYVFEELPDFIEGQFRSGSHNGVAEISFAHDGSWYVSAISLDCHNGQCGDAAQSKMIPVSFAYQPEIWSALSESLQSISYDYIQDKVNEANVSLLEAAE